MSRDQQFKKGKSGNPVGRPKGSGMARVNVWAQLKKMNFKPFKELVNIAKTANSEKVRCDALIELCSYVAPKIKQVELDKNNDQPFSITLNLSPTTTNTTGVIIHDEKNEENENEKT